MEDASPFHQAPETEQDPLSEPSPVEGSPGEEEKAEEASWRFVDHFSVGIPSTKIRFRHKRVVMYGFDNDEQILMEEDKKLGVVTVKRFPTASFGLKFLRATYTLVALLVACFLWAFCWQIIIFLFLNMAAEGGKTQADPDLSTGHVVGIIASIPLFIHGLASICAFGSTFVSDTWKGNPLFQQLMGFSNAVVMESICFLFFLGVPGVTMAVSLMAGSENWWETTLKVWVCCVLFCMAVFAILVVICEVTLCMEIITLQDENSSSRWQCVRKAILNTQIMFYSGYQKEEFLVDTMDNKHHIKTKSSLYSRLTLIGCCQNQLFEKLDPPVNSFTTDEIVRVMPRINVYFISIPTNPIVSERCYAFFYSWQLVLRTHVLQEFKFTNGVCAQRPWLLAKGSSVVFAHLRHNWINIDCLIDCGVFSLVRLWCNCGRSCIHYRGFLLRRAHSIIDRTNLQSN